MIIDTNKTPTTLEDSREMKIVEHRSMGVIDFDIEKVRLMLTKGQMKAERKREYITGEEALLEMQKENALNATVLEYLMENQELLKDWEEGLYEYCFYGTVYQDKYGEKYVRSIRHLAKWEGRYIFLHMRVPTFIVGAVYEKPKKQSKTKQK